MKIVVTGANGQLGQDLLLQGAIKQHDMVGLGRAELDVTQLSSVRSQLHALQPDVIVHAAAYTAVDAAESEVERAFAVNAYGTRNLALVANELDARLCYVSTDYVFDGEATQPYGEYDMPHPKTVYGKSKFAGEQLVQQLSHKHYIVRTSWLYGLHGANFVKTMLELGREQHTVQVVQDQVGSPTYTVDLANFVLDLVGTEFYGIYHASNTGACSWYEFAQAIFALAGLSVRVTPCTTEAFMRPAPRPRYSVLDHLALRAQGLSDLRPWPEALDAFLQAYRTTAKGVKDFADHQ
ncbi:dTDP-4-dehydrorhamnose reductase [Sulfoacidibacillus thermotolerans]|uniref:dTDP-4-dehydrorhamnose reductase n=1 Tax=Sulfoacidibacillus thermotolerans TaxID=1765684 RepID=A0A2U3D671_SULT2|nr:dTDP-4-dehydrorhamnose reductase [Sulfoacidibacillus thermotolerans]PWI56768.1 dTDP-4-dehydrorhamnose reductase [Sulfoacidibacillus thermotolerans]